ncbi:hypothetical protein ABL78_5656 [Leptomonas seymouri]|uniref:Kinesin motor domain-containing protein n=1 Tax=Leptomonas seymouri TaxID=5684 RepID=A0A0N0P4H1_LEPSE|nr:hypothetical protein ABL78_5656 [Leptomonas seymouri]|eukprot:KPI85289.1 hypothetical protein ABL78_5656 [Leptomonas seymouri]
MPSRGIRSLAEHISVYARVRPCAAADGASCFSVDTTHNTIHCSTDEFSSPPSRPFSTSRASLRRRQAPSSPSNPKAEALAARSVAPHKPHPPPSWFRSQQTQCFTLDRVVKDLHSADTAAFLGATAQTCAEDYLLEGRDVTVLCSGDEGSGKTSTAFGDAEEPGLCARLFLALFAAMETSSSLIPASAAAVPRLSYGAPEQRPPTQAPAAVAVSPPMQHEVTLSCILLQGERVVDLLAEAKATDTDTSNLVDQAHPSFSSSCPLSSTQPPARSSAGASAAPKPTVTMNVRGDAVVRGVSQRACSSAREAISFVQRCRRAQASLATSFGHVIVMVDVTAKEMEMTEEGSEVAEVRQARLHLLDLASVHTASTSPAANSNGGTAFSKAESQGLGSRAEEVAVRPSLIALRAVIVGFVDAAARERRFNPASREGFQTGFNTPYVSAAQSTPAPTTASVHLPPASSSHYRQCKLAMLLKGYLGGACHTIVIAHVRSEPEYLSESLATLQLAKQFMCVPEESKVHRALNSAVQVRQLQRQLASLQSDVRLQMELSTQNSLLTREAAAKEEEKADATTAASVCCSTSPGTRKAAGLANTLRRKDSKRNALLGDAGNLSEVGTLSQPSKLSAFSLPTDPTSAPLQASVADFIAGRLPTLPVTTVEEMNTCFELLRRQVADHALRLNAAMADLREAQASAVAAAEATRRLNSRCSRSSSSARCSTSLGQERPRASLIRSGGNSSQTDSTPEGRRTSLQKWGAEFRAPWASPSSPPANASVNADAASAAAGGRPYQTSLLEEPSFTRLTAESGVGCGTAPAPISSIPFQATTTSTATRSILPADRQTLAPPTFPNKYKVSWMFGGPEGETSTVARRESTTTDSMSVCSAAEQSETQLWNASMTDTPFNLPSTFPLGPREQEASVVCTASQSQVERTRHENAPRRNTTLSTPLSKPPTHRQSPAPATAPVTAANSLSPPLHDPAATFPSESLSQTRSVESVAFDSYVTGTAEGRRLVGLVRQEEATVVALQQRLATAGTTKVAAAATAAYGAAVAQLARHRQALLYRFEAWHGLRATRGGACTSEALVCDSIPNGKAVGGGRGGSSRLHPFSAGGGSTLRIPRLRQRPSSAPAMPTPQKASLMSLPNSATVGTSLYPA